MAGQEESESTNPPEGEPDVEEQYRELYNRLDDSPLGRAVGVWITEEQSSYSTEEQQKMGVALPDDVKKRFVKLFHALPATAEGDQHVLLTRDGRMLLVKQSPHSPDAYNAMFSENGTLIDFQLAILTNALKKDIDIGNLLRDFFPQFGIDRTQDSYNPLQIETIHRAFDQSIEVAQQRLELIEQNKQLSIKHQVQGLERLFGKPSTSPPPEGE